MLARHDFVLEGGALDHDGEGTVLTTRECLLNPNRNRGWTQAVAEDALSDRGRARSKVIWLDKGLIDDHTDGHVDNLARFVAPGVVAIPLAFGEKDPHAGIYDAAAQALAGVTDAAGPDAEGDAHALARPGAGAGAPAGPRLAHEFRHRQPRGDRADLRRRGRRPGRRRRWVSCSRAAQVIGLPSRALLTGGGSFHCITQQEPA